jgi:hypothetical protein
MRHIHRSPLILFSTVVILFFVFVASDAQAQSYFGRNKV